MPKPVSAPLRVSLVIPRDGPGGLFAPSCESLAEFAAEQLNESGGILGRQVLIDVYDASRPVADLVADVTRGAREGRVDAVTGWHISTVRQRLAPAVCDLVPYVYTSLYEGGDHTTGLYCTGELPHQQIAPALRWFRDQLGTRRWTVLGSDYMWPRLTVVQVRRYLDELGLDLVDEFYEPYGAVDACAAVDRIEARGCDAVLMLLVGQDGVLVNREFGRRRLQDRILRFSPLMEENMLLATGSPGAANLYSSAAYFKDLPTQGALDLMAGYVARFGEYAPTLNNMAESCYEGVMALGALCARAGSTAVGPVGALDGSAGFDSPRGPMSLRGNHFTQSVFLARAEGVEFDVIDQLV